MLPAQFVRSEVNDQCVVYRVRVPAASVPELRALQPGDWVTGSPPRRAADPSAAVAGVHGYNDAA